MIGDEGEAAKEVFVVFVDALRAESTSIRAEASAEAQRFARCPAMGAEQACGRVYGLASVIVHHDAFAHS